eukprot:356051-Chlamydomonas_euryale.AAC.1
MVATGGRMAGRERGRCATERLRTWRWQALARRRGGRGGGTAAAGAVARMPRDVLHGVFAVARGSLKAP